ncbi:MAG: hypothetical protein ABEN55_14930, partial [Bradymonadaceae bacterium]
NLAERAFTAGFNRAGGTGVGGAVADIVDELERLVRRGEQRAEEGDVDGAMAIWTPLAEVVLDHIDLKGVGTERLRELLAELESKLAGYLPAVATGPVREAALGVLWQLYLVDLAGGGGELGDRFREVIEEATDADERRYFAARARNRLETLADEGDAPSETVVELVDFIGAIEQGPPDERILAALDHLEPGPAIVEALLAMNELEEAVSRAEAIPVSYEFGRALDAFVEAGHPDWAERLACDRLDGSSGQGSLRSPGVQEWLVRFYERQNRPEAAL